MKQTKKANWFIDGFVLKVLAFIFMTFDHVGYMMEGRPGLSSTASIFRIIGRLAFPLFMFMLAEGMTRSRHKGKYLLRLFYMWALITGFETIGVTIPYFRSTFGIDAYTLSQQPFTDLLVNGALLYCFTLPKWKKLFAIIPLSVIVLSFGCDVYEWTHVYVKFFPTYLRVGYGLVGTILACSFFFAYPVAKFLGDKCMVEGEAKTRSLTRFVGILFWVIGFMVLMFSVKGANPSTYRGGGYRWMSWEAYSFLSIPVLLFYNEQKGYTSKWWRIFSYFYFLIHVGVIAVIFYFVL